jgi:hypothetical protein
MHAVNCTDTTLVATRWCELCCVRALHSVVLIMATCNVRTRGARTLAQSRPSARPPTHPPARPPARTHVQRVHELTRTQARTCTRARIQDSRTRPRMHARTNTPSNAQQRTPLQDTPPAPLRPASSLAALPPTIAQATAQAQAAGAGGGSGGRTVDAAAAAAPRRRSISCGYAVLDGTTKEVVRSGKADNDASRKGDHRQAARQRHRPAGSSQLYTMYPSEELAEFELNNPMRHGFRSPAPRGGEIPRQGRQGRRPVRLDGSDRRAAPPTWPQRGEDQGGPARAGGVLLGAHVRSAPKRGQLRQQLLWL